MKRCPNHHVSTGLKFCTQCGEAMVEVETKCLKCGEPIILEQKFCGECGAEVDPTVYR